jgi:hypothetical protein
MPGRILAASVLLGLIGCLPATDRMALVPSESTGLKHVAARPPEGAAQPNEDVARRVGMVGEQLMAANRSLGIKPRFATLGVPQEELFHQGPEAIYISEGLVARCQTDSTLAALLALELGRAMAERDVREGTSVSRSMARMLPTDVAGNNDTHGTFGPADGTRMMELAKMEKAAKTPHAPPEPESLAKVYLRRAGFPDDLRDAESLAQLADANGKLGRSGK